MREFMNGDLWHNGVGDVFRIESTLYPNKLVISDKNGNTTKVKRTNFRANHKSYVLQPRPQPKGFVVIGCH